MTTDPSFFQRLGQFARQEVDAFGRDPFNAIPIYRLGRGLGQWAYPYLREGADYVAGELQEGYRGMAPSAAAAPAPAPAVSGGPTLESAIASGLMKRAPAYDPDLEPAQIVKENAVTQAAAPKTAASSPDKAAPIKAIRMPNGKIVFTNTSDYDSKGEVMDRAEAGRQLRAGALRAASAADVNLAPASLLAPAPGSERLFGPQPDPTGDLGRAAMQSMQERGPDYTPGLSIMGKTDASVLEDHMMALALARLKSAQQQEAIPPVLKALLESPQAMTMLVTSGMAQKPIAAIESELQRKIALLRSDPRYAGEANKEALDTAIMEATAEATRRKNDVLAALGRDTLRGY